MIKINLLPSRAVRKKKPVAGRTFVLLALMLLGLEGAGLYVWHDSVKSDLTRTNQQVTQLDAKVQRLQKVKQAIAQDEATRKLVEEQNVILERLKDGKFGPPSMMLFLSYVLTRPADTLANRGELTALERAGWNLQWDPDSVWLRMLKEDEYGVITIEGEARAHQDVAEFYQRLRSSIFFKNLDPGPQERKYDQGIEMKYVAFKGTAELNYQVPSLDDAAAARESEAADGDAPAPEQVDDDVIIPGTPSAEAVPGAEKN